MIFQSIAEFVAFPPVGLDRARLARVLAGKTVLITGATFGIGEIVARLCGAAGARVVLVARTVEKLQQVESEINAAGGQATSIACDLRDEAQVEALAAQLTALGQPPDIVVSNAGKSIRRSIFEALEKFDDVTRTIGVNYLGPARLALALIPHLVERKGQFINVCAANVLILPSPNWAAYQASKSAFDQWFRCVGPELRARGVAASTIYLPLVRTRMIAPTKHYAHVPAMKPEQAAHRILRLMINRHSWQTPWWLPFAHIASALGRGLYEFICEIQQRALVRR